MPLNNGCTDFTIREFSNYALAGQGRLPICYVPPSCTLGFTSNSITNTSARGASDGEITVNWSGSTGTTSYYLNGSEQTGTTASNSVTFTGLEAGFYDVTIEEDTCAAIYNDLQVIDGDFRTLGFTINEAADLGAAENPINYEIRTQETSTGIKAEYEIRIASTINDGDYIEFQLTSPFEYTQKFYAKSFPNKSNYFLASTLTDGSGNVAGSNTLAEIAQSLADALQQDSVIPKIYTISYDSDKIIKLRAKQEGSRFSLTNNNVTVSGDGIDGNTIVVGVNRYDGQQSNSYSIYCEVFQNPTFTQYPNVGNKDEYIRIAEIELPYQQSNVHRFDISPILKNFVASTRPDFDFTGYTVQRDMLKPYFLKVGEKYPLISNSNTKKKRYKTSTDVKWVINSALDWYDINDMEEQGYLGDFFHNLKSNFTLTLTPDDPTTEDLNLEVSNYLHDTGRTDTTNIMFRFVDDENSQDTGWVTGTSHSFSGYTYYDGDVFVSGETSGLTVTYSKSYSYETAYDIGGVTSRSQNQKLTGIKFLTNAPNPKLIQRESQEYLYFILQSDYGEELNLKGDIEYYDGTSTTGVTFFNIQQLTGNTAGGVLALNLSYEKLGLSSYENSGSTIRKIKNIEFAVYQTDTSGNTEQYTEAKTYRLEINDRPRKYGIIFQNKLGGYDSFDWVGIVEDTINRESSTYTVPVSFDLTGTAPQGFKSTASYNTKVTKKVIVNSGWVNRETFDWIIELMESNEIYSYTTDNQNYLVLDAYKYKKSSLDDLYEIEATFIQTLYENNVNV